MRALAVIALVLSLLPSPAAAEPACGFRLGFKAIADQIPDLVGSCLEDEHFNAANGNAEQRTTAHHGQGGLLVWRKADNWTAYTDGATTWINGPQGLQSRPNSGPLFAWEAPAAGTAPVPAQDAPRPKPTFVAVSHSGSIGLAVVQTAPRASCALTYVMPNGTVSRASGLGAAVADDRGIAFWRWTISLPGANTPPATGTVTAICQGQSITAPMAIP